MCAVSEVHLMMTGELDGDLGGAVRFGVLNGEDMDLVLLVVRAAFDFAG